jgi:hypothetical protein
MAAPRTRNTTVPGSAGFSPRSPSFQSCGQQAPVCTAELACNRGRFPRRQHRYRGGAQAARQAARGPKQELPLRAEDERRLAGIQAHPVNLNATPEGGDGVQAPGVRRGEH